MAAGTLIIAMIFFAARGYFLGLAGVFARVLGLLSGYIVGFSYRSDLAAIIGARTDTGAHPVVLQIISGALLFFGTMFVVSFVVIGLFKLLAKLLPPFRTVLTKEATGSRIAGAAVNAGIAAMIVLSGIYIYGLTLGKNQPPDDLQRVANRFGSTMVDVAKSLIDEEDRPTQQDIKKQSMSLLSSAISSSTSLMLSGAASDTSEQQSATTQPQQITGSAEIISTDNPQKRMLIERVREVLSSSDSGDDIDLQAMLENEQLSELVDNPEVREQAMQYLQANPEQMMEALNNPKFRALLEQWESQ